MVTIGGGLSWFGILRACVGYAGMGIVLMILGQLITSSREIRIRHYCQRTARAIAGVGMGAAVAVKLR